MVDISQAQPVYVYSFRRSGTNLFSSYLNLHPEIFAVNTGGSKIRQIPKDDILSKSLFANRVHYRKDRIQYVIFDEIDPKFYNSEYKGIVLLRDWNLINKSCKKIGLPTVKRGMYMNLLKLTNKKNLLVVQLTDFIRDPHRICNKVTKYLGLSPIKDYDPKHCICGDKFTYVETDKIEGESRTHPTPQKYKYCPTHKSILSAHGGTNPISPLDPTRQSK